MPKRIVAALSVGLEDGTEAYQGDEVEMSDADVARFEATSAIVPEGFASFDEFSQAKLDAYAAGRGDIEAASRLGQRVADSQRGGISDLSLAPTAGPGALADHIRERSLTVDETVALAEGDPAKAATVIEAEKLATGGEPRKGVVEPLERLAESSADE